MKTYLPRSVEGNATLPCKTSDRQLPSLKALQIKPTALGVSLLTLEQTLLHHKILISPDFGSPKMQREGSQWLRAYDYTYTKVVYFGCYKTGLNEVWRGDDSTLSEEQKKEVASNVRRHQAELKKVREEEQIRIKLAIQSAWPNKIERGETGYMKRKQIAELYGCKIDMNEHGAFLLVPCRDVEGELWNCQRIFNQKMSSGDKFFLSGAKIEGLFHTLSPVHAEGIIYIAEGFATAASIHASLQGSATVVCAFNAGNLKTVSLALRDKYPKARFIFCADNDQWTHKPDGAKWNPGLEYATQAAGLVHGTVVLPQFTDLSSHPTDFNDLHLLEGLDQVKEQLTNPKPQDHAEIPVSNPNSEAGLAQQVFSEFDGRIAKRDQDIFVFEETHWKHLDKHVAADYFKKKIDLFSEGRLKYKDITSTYSRFLMHIPHVPEGMDLFSPRPDCVNLLNGTLHVRKKNGIFTTEFLPHCREDYLINILPYTYDPADSHTNAKLDGVLQRVFEGDPDQDQKLAGVQEMFGSAICGQFPMLHMLFGAPGTGKSTIANLVKRLVGQKNTCQIPPTRWNSFHMWNMIRKQVNIDTDIPTQGKIQDDMVKKVIEHGVVQIQRKNLSDIETKLTCCNIFCANKLPPFVDGDTGAQQRRWLLFEFLHVVIPAEKFYDQTIWDAVFESDPQGVFNYALAGVMRLCQQRGVFTVSESGRAKIKAWGDESNEAGLAVKEFLDDIRHGETVNEKQSIVLVGEDHKIERKMLWTIFKMNHEGNALKWSGPNKAAFYSAMERCGYGSYKIEGLWYFKGIGVKEAPRGIC